MVTLSSRLGVLTVVMIMMMMMTVRDFSSDD